MARKDVILRYSPGIPPALDGLPEYVRREQDEIERYLNSPDPYAVSEGDYAAQALTAGVQINQRLGANTPMTINAYNAVRAEPEGWENLTGGLAGVYEIPERGIWEFAAVVNYTAYNTGGSSAITWLYPVFGLSGVPVLGKVWTSIVANNFGSALAGRALKQMNQNDYVYWMWNILDSVDSGTIDVGFELLARQWDKDS